MRSRIPLTDSLLLLENGEVVSSLENKSIVPFKNNIHPIPFFENFELSADKIFWVNPHVAFDTGNSLSLLMTRDLCNEAVNYIDRSGIKCDKFLIFLRRCNNNGTMVKFTGDYPPLLPQEKSILKDGQHLCLLGLQFLKTFGIGFVSDGNRSWLIPRTLLNSFRSQRWIGQEIDQ